MVGEVVIGVQFMLEVERRSIFTVHLRQNGFVLVICFVGCRRLVTFD